jgi:cis-L-3-hydroxyproline dehydratase
MAENVNKYLKDGYRKFQLKVGGNPSDDIARIRAVRELLDVKTKELRESSKAKVRGGLMKAGDYDESNLYIPLLCDANTGWLAHEAIKVRTYVCTTVSSPPETPPVFFYFCFYFYS